MEGLLAADAELVAAYREAGRIVVALHLGATVLQAFVKPDGRSGCAVRFRDESDAAFFEQAGAAVDAAFFGQLDGPADPSCAWERAVAARVIEEKRNLVARLAGELYTEGALGEAEIRRVVEEVG
jgi:hypothetical protein